MSPISTILLIILSLALSQAQIFSNGHEAATDRLIETSIKPVPILVDAGWQLFLFTNGGARMIFHISSPQPTILRITDAYCPGDSFAVYESKALLGVTPMPTATCEHFTTDPHVAFNSTAWSHGEFRLDPGDRHIGVLVMTSPHTAGKAFIRADRVAA